MQTGSLRAVHFAVGCDAADSDTNIAESTSKMTTVHIVPFLYLPVVRTDWPMIEFNHMCVTESQSVPFGRGCEPYWQHIARCRELSIVRELLPPPGC